VGAIRQIKQQGGESPTSNTRLEITYGGKESPFGGLHLGPPPAYIDANCFTDANSVLVVDNKLVVVSMQPFALPEHGGVLLKIGTFYNSILGQVNYMLSYNATPETINGVPVAKVAFSIIAWNYDNGGAIQVLGTDSLVLFQFTTSTLPTQASLTIPVVMGETSSFVDSGVVSVNLGVSGTLVSNANYAYAPGDTIVTVVAGLVASINAVSGTTEIAAAPSADGLSIVFTSVNAGAATNTLCVEDVSASGTADTPPAFYLPIREYTFLQGGADGISNPLSSAPLAVSATAVGGTLYLSGFGNWPWILKYSGPGLFSISSMYQGAQVLKKFAGSLIAVGVTQQLINVLQNQDMIFSWSAAEDLDEWSPVDSSGDVTGAGFAQIADIDDKLTGLIVSNNVAWILRAQGISYATALGSGQQPYQFAHIGLGDQGEGCPLPALAAQYDQTGVYVGNSNVFQISGQITPIGDKIKSALLPLLLTTQQIIKAVIFPAINEGGDTYPLAVILVGTTLFLFNVGNQTWMTFEIDFPNNVGPVVADTLFVGNANTPMFKFPLVVAYQVGTGQPVAYQIVEQFPDENALISGNASVTFPQEEVLFGRDVTIDSLYISLWANITEAVDVECYINDTLVGVMVLNPGAPWNTLDGRPTEAQLFFTNIGGTNVVTAKSPQMRLEWPTVNSTNEVNQLRMSKIQMYCSFDPEQTPQ
jgi:hypothetical protein